MNDKPVKKQQNDTYNDLVDQVADAVLTTSGVQHIGVAGLPEEMARKYVVAIVAGVPLFTDANIARASNAAKGGVFAKSALVYAELWGADIEPEEDKSLRGTELNATMCFAYGERRDAHGIELNLGATAPSS